MRVANINLPQEMIPPRPHNKKYFVDPNSQESPVVATALGAAASHCTRVSGPLNGELREDSSNELNNIVLCFLWSVPI